MTALNTKTATTLITILLIFTLQFQFHAALAAADGAEAASALTNAENAMAAAYGATANAEQAGANITSFLNKLDSAGGDLSDAEAAYRQGDFNSTLTLANSCSQLATEIIVDANQSRLEALGSRYMDTWIKMVVSIVGMVGVGLSSFWGWRFFRRRHHQHVLNPKPEAVSHGY